MDVITGYSNKILNIDLTRRAWSVEILRQQDRKLYLGGRGLGIKLLYDRMEPGVDPLGTDNIIAVLPGLLTGTDAPCSEYFTIVSKSPLTGIMTGSSCAGPFGLQLKGAGYDALIIRGKSDKKCVIYFDHDVVEFRDAKYIWGLDTFKTQDALLKNDEIALVIGPAGENLVRFANIASGRRLFGRGGLGAVMGSKNIKAVVAGKSHFNILPAHSESFKRSVQKASLFIRNNAISKAMNQFGTAVNILPVNEAGILPVWNYFFGTHDNAFRISGEMIREKHGTSHDACHLCDIKCARKGKFRFGTASVPEYESLVMLGSNLGIFDREQIAYFNDLCNRLGMDTISAGGTLAWVMEAGEKGYIDTDLMFGASSGIADALNDIAHLNSLGQEMALGSRALSEKYGGQDFAMHVKGLEIGGYDPRGAYGQGLSYAVANCGGCHLSAFLVPFEVFLNLLKPDAYKSKPVFVKFVEDLTSAVNALQLCPFTLYPFILESFLIRHTPTFLFRFLAANLPGAALKIIDPSLYPDLFFAVTGIRISSRTFLEAGERIHILERFMNTREGISRKDDTLPDRMLFECIHGDPGEKTVPLDQMLDRYYKKRGYKSDGAPNRSILTRLKII